MAYIHSNSDMKECTKCHAVFPLSFFYKHGKMRDGHLNKCKECVKEAVRKNRADKVEYYREFDRMRYATDPNVRKRIRRVAQKWKEDHPKRHAAHSAVNNAVRDGRLSKPSECEWCGDPHKRIHGHHEDYDKPLDVIWLCPPCHKKAHR